MFMNFRERKGDKEGGGESGRERGGERGRNIYQLPPTPAWTGIEPTTFLIMG